MDLKVKQQGFGLLVYGLLALAILGALAGIGYSIRKAGMDAVRAEWAAANAKAIQEQRAREMAAKLLADTAAAELAAAQQKGAEYAEKWRKARAAATKPLASCPEPPRTTPSPVGLRFSWRFVSLYDRAWTGRQGQPVLRDPTPGEVNDPDTPSPIGAGEVLDNQAANAALCSADRRKLDSLIEQIERLRAGWK